MLATKLWRLVYYFNKVMDYTKRFRLVNECMSKNEDYCIDDDDSCKILPSLLLPLSFFPRTLSFINDELKSKHL
jgi:hypothetical protein